MQPKSPKRFRSSFRKNLSTVLFFGFVSIFFMGAELIDRVAAIVNDDIILLSEVEEKLFVLAAQGQLQGRDSSEVGQVRREILDTLIEEKLVVQRATSQGITADENEVTRRVNEAMATVRSNFKSEAEFEQALSSEGITETMLRDRYKQDVEQEFLAQRIVGREIRGKVEVTTDDVQKFYDENKDQIPAKPDEIKLSHLVRFPISNEQEQAAQDKVEQARARIVGGEAFEDIAREVSEDPTANRGGMLGWFDRGDLDPDFQAAVDSLDFGQISAPVRTRFGYHLIEVLERDGSRFSVRHILVLIEPTGPDLERAHKDAEAALARLRAGEVWESVVLATSDDDLTRDNGGELGWTSTETLLPNVIAALDSLTVGDFSDVVQTERGYHVFRLEERRTGGPFSFDEIRDRLRGLLEQQELQVVYDEWMTALRDSAYIEIKAWTR